MSMGLMQYSVQEFAQTQRPVQQIFRSNAFTIALIFINKPNFVILNWISSDCCDILYVLIL